MNPVMVLVNTGNWSTPVFVFMVLKAVITALIGMMGLATGFTGYFYRRCNVIERIVLIVGGIMLVDPGTITDIVGISLVLAVYIIQRLRGKATAA